MSLFEMFSNRFLYGIFVSSTGGYLEIELVTFFTAETLKNLEKLLRVVEQDPNLQIENGNEKPGTKPGDNYMSRVIRTNISGVRGDKTR